VPDLAGAHAELLLGNAGLQERIAERLARQPDQRSRSGIAGIPLASSH
jgi:hypothetical protein